MPGAVGGGSALFCTATELTGFRLTDGGTYDLLPSGPTGTYWADGVLLGSTLFADH
jgi:hypothetical protein